MNTTSNQKPTKKKKRNKMFYERIRSRYINLFTDFGFKKIFGEECNKDLLLDFLNELLYEEQGRIVSISYLKLERLGISSNSRRAIFDLYCENEKGEKFIVELQKEEQQFFKDRTVFYSTFPIIEQAPKKGNWHFELKAVYVIAILDFVFEEDENDLQKYRYDIKLTDIQTKKVFYDKLTFIYLEMPKFTKELNELETRFEKWMYVLRNITLLDNLPDNFRESIFEKIFEAAEIAQLTQAEYISYMDDIKVYWDLSSCIYTANAKGLAEGLEKGLEKGLKKGLKKGRAEGLKEGFEKGRMEEKIQFVMNSFQAGLSHDTIAGITGLTTEKVAEIIDL